VQRRVYGGQKFPKKSKFEEKSSEESLRFLKIKLAFSIQIKTICLLISKISE